MLNRRGALLMLVVVLFAPGVSAATLRFPWTFGMTKQEVQAVTKYGPYRSFSNGDLETYNGVLDGRKQDFQFFFNNDKLVRIGIDMYEGQNLGAAAEQWMNLYKYMVKQFGPIETPNNRPPSGDDASQFMATAQITVAAGAKTQMAPVKQPDDTFVFASFDPYAVKGHSYYIIFLYFNPPHV